MFKTIISRRIELHNISLIRNCNITLLRWNNAAGRRSTTTVTENAINKDNYNYDNNNNNIKNVVSSSHYYFLYRKGDHPYGTREYFILQKQEEDIKTKTLVIPETGLKHNILASIRAHRNILFSAKQYNNNNTESNNNSLLLLLLQTALIDCSIHGEQPQALATLYGLCQYVQSCFNNNTISSSKVLQSINDPITLEDIRTVATTGIFPNNDNNNKDAVMIAWEQLAKEFIYLGLSEECQFYMQLNNINNNNNKDITTTNNNNDDDDDRTENQLFSTMTAELVAIEHLADNKNPIYLKSAGGAMARFFFL